MDQLNINLDLTLEHAGLDEDTSATPDPHKMADRSIFLHIRTNRAGHYNVLAYGTEFQRDGSLCMEGDIHLSREDITAATSELLRGWSKDVIQHQPPGQEAFTFEGSPVVDFGEDRARTYLSKQGLALARHGNKLFKRIFCNGDDALRRLGERLEHALRNRPQTITVISDDFFVPWNMLYVCADPDTRISASNASWDWSGFLGYTHLIEHVLPTAGRASTRQRIGNPQRRLRTGLQLDLRLINPERPAGPLAPVHAVIDQHTDYATRSCKQDVADAFCDPATADEILLFGAHGTAERFDDQGMIPAQVTLSDDDPICSSDLDFWRDERKKPLPEPLCFMMVCEGGRTATHIHEGLGRPLFQLGVGCLVGPQLEVPMDFAGLYTHRFFQEAFTGARIAHIARELTREFLIKHASPLGLIFTLLRGIDTHLATPDQQKRP
ncbi:hypothetical protein ACFQ9Z_37925 [Streptomyces sp. NPDC056580]|uniref:hypothetical protein n=1 Tax=Streptomyces sp. NPDC056580 TaxID=3345872 RepID=UPI0036A35A7E